MIIETSRLVMLLLAFFACGYGLAVFMFLSEIRLGIQVQREVREKMKQEKDVSKDEH